MLIFMLSSPSHSLHLPVGKLLTVTFVDMCIIFGSFD
jgi:hypothetical protein